VKKKQKSSFQEKKTYFCIKNFVWVNFNKKSAPKIFEIGRDRIFLCLSYYKHGNVMLWKVLALPFISLFIGWKIIPKFYNYGSVSTFDYLSKKFSPLLARIALVSMVFGTVYYLSNVSYIPGIVFKTKFTDYWN
jgi:hypothetical protein